MSDIQLFRLTRGAAEELSGRAATVEKQLQSLIEAQMTTLLGVRFLASEYATGKTHRGRIDSLGLDENGCPVIIEYKRHSNENVISQGLFYLDWLLDEAATRRKPNRSGRTVKMIPRPLEPWRSMANAAPVTCIAAPPTAPLTTASVAH